VKRSLLALLPLTLWLISCEKDFKNVGKDIQPPSDQLNVFYSDTSSIIAYSSLVDSVRTDETSVAMLGSILDPVMGMTTAGFYTQLRLSASNHSFGDNPAMDSLMLSLDYRGIYGDSLAQITLKVYEMGDKIYYDSNYYSHQSVIINQPALAVLTFVPNLTDSLVVDGDTLGPHLRINLSDITPHLGEKLLGADTNQLANNDNFLNFFFGLYITAEVATTGGAILYIEPVSNLTKMRLYYRNDEEDSLSFDFNTSTGTAHFGHFDHDYALASADFKAQVLEGDTSLGRLFCYNQAMAGVKTFIRFPYLRNYYLQGNAAVNEARFFLNARTEDGSLFAPAANLVLVRSDGEDGYDFLSDQVEGTEYFGGVYDADKQGYWFRITYTVQDLMRQAYPDYGFELFISGGSLNAERVILAGTSPVDPVPVDQRMRLVITYTLPE